MGWWFIPASVVFWTVLWPVGLLAAVVWLVARSRRLRRLQTPVDRRIARLLRWYPPRWRRRHGDEFAALLHDTIDDGRGGVRMTLDVARTGLAERVESLDRSSALAFAWTACWIPIFPQGIVPMIMMGVGYESRSWFLALYVPEPFGWLVAGAWLAVGIAMLGWAITTTRRLAASRRAACVTTD
jgi:hypothetical protein